VRDAVNPGWKLAQVVNKTSARHDGAWELLVLGEIAAPPAVAGGSKYVLAGSECKPNAKEWCDEGVARRVSEWALEDSLPSRISEFLLELGAGCALYGASTASSQATADFSMDRVP
jgi:hypothetical protein